MAEALHKRDTVQINCERSVCHIAALQVVAALLGFISTGASARDSSGSPSCLLSNIRTSASVSPIFGV